MSQAQCRSSAGLVLGAGITPHHSYSKDTVLRLSRCLTLIACLLAPACAQLTVLPDGARNPSCRPTATALRSALPLVPTPVSVAYRPVASCQYETLRAAGSAGSASERYVSSLTVRAAADKLAVVETSAGTTRANPAHRGATRKLYDFNSFSSLTGTRNTPETEAATSAQVKQLATFKSPHTVNEYAIRFPEYVTALLRPRTDRGLRDARRRSLAVGGLCLSRDDDLPRSTGGAAGSAAHQPKRGGRTYLVGFDLVDPQTAMPVLSVISSGTEDDFSQLSCS